MSKDRRVTAEFRTWPVQHCAQDFTTVHSLLCLQQASAHSSRSAPNCRALRVEGTAIPAQTPWLQTQTATLTQAPIGRWSASAFYSSYCSDMPSCQWRRYYHVREGITTETFSEKPKQTNKQTLSNYLYKREHTQRRQEISSKISIYSVT